MLNMCPHQLSLLFCLAVLPLGVRGQSLNNGLVACYLMDGDAIDSGPNSLSGVTTALPGMDRNGVAGGALIFNGSTTYLNMPTDLLLKPAFPFTVSLWMNAADDTGGLYTSDYTVDTYAGFWIALNADATININYGNGGPIGIASRRSEFSVMDFQMGQWFLLTAVFHSLNDMRLFVGCEQVATDPSGQASSVSYTSASGSLGRHDSMLGGPPGYFNGIMDEVALWDRALTIQEIELLCNGGLANAVSVEELTSTTMGGLQIHPNPAVDLVSVVSLGTRSLNGCECKIVDTMGNVVLMCKLAQSTTQCTIDVSSLPSGVYQLVLETPSSRHKPTSFVIAR